MSTRQGGVIRVALFAFLFLSMEALAQPCNEVCRIEKVEPQFLKRGLAERHGDRLSILTRDKTLASTDDRKACDAGDANDCVLYVLIANAPQSHSLVVEKFAGLEGETKSQVPAPIPV